MAQPAPPVGSSPGGAFSFGGGDCLRKLSWFLAALALALLLASLVPLATLAPYAGPAADDFGYGTPVYFALQAGQGLSGALSALWENLRYTYANWQGTFSSVLLFSLQPGVFSSALYVITPFVMLAAILSPGFLALGLLRGADGRGRLLLGCVFGLVSVQLLPSPADGIYWWNGAVHYLVFWCLGVLTVTLHVRLLRRERFGVGGAFLSALLCLLAFFAGGGNYSTALVLAVAEGVLIPAALAARSGWRTVTASVIIALCALGGLLFSAAAPGNAVRQATLTGLEPWPAIGASFQLAWDYLGRCLTPVTAGALLLCVPVFLWTVRDRDYLFPLPFLALPGCFCLYSALFTPPLYAMGRADISRMDNLFWLAGVFLLFGGACYLAGWLTERLQLWDRRWAHWCAALLAAAGVVVLLTAGPGAWPGTAAGRAQADLDSGRAEAYRQVRLAREAVYADKSVPPPRFAEPEYPDCFPASQLLTWNPDVIVNEAAADLPCYHACGGEVTFVGVERAEALWDAELNPEDFSRTFWAGPELCVPLREVCDRLGFGLSYDVATDTIFIRTGL